MAIFQTVRLLPHVYSLQHIRNYNKYIEKYIQLQAVYNVIETAGQLARVFSRIVAHLF